MITLKSDSGYTANSIRALLFRFLLTIITSIAITLLVQSSWSKNLNLYHTILEATCVFIALSTFMSIWYTYDKGKVSNFILGFGYLVVAIFDALHIYYHLKLDLTAVSYFDLSTRFWILGRLAEAVTILMVVTSIKALTSKYISLAISLGVAIGIAYFVVAKHDVLPFLLTAQGVTPLKKFLEYVVIAMYIVSLFNIKDKLDSKGQIAYKYIFIAILMSICAEVCFTIYSLISNITWTLGHILKIISYFYLFKGVFISTVLFPYDELVIKNKNLQAVNEELNKLSSTMKDLLDALPIGIQKFDNNGRLKYTNKRYEELLQCSIDEIQGMTMLELARKFSMNEISEEDIQPRSWKDGPSNTLQTCRTLKGERLKLSIKASKIQNGTLVIINDTKKEQELQNLNIQTETILNSINNGVMMIDENMRIILINKAYEDIFEVDKNEILGMDINQLNKVIGLEDILLPDEVAAGKAPGQGVDVSITSFKGNQKMLSLYISTIKDIDGDNIGIISVGTDVTEYKKEQQRMIQQEKLALLGQMGAGIVHETRNFLTTIKGRCQLIDMMTDNQGIKKHSDKINSDVEEVNRIISEFLFLSKPRETELVEVSIHDVFGSIKGMVETSSLVKGVDLEINLCEDERYMLCDESQMKQVILNICKNGIDAMTGQLNAKLVVETGFIEDSNAAFISIKDNGAGISEENLKKMGTPFFTTKTTGTGLGLSVCYKIIREHGGRINVESELGKGTTFTIILPCVVDEENESAV